MNLFAVAVSSSRAPGRFPCGRTREGLQEAAKGRGFPPNTIRFPVTVLVTAVH